MRSIGPHFAAPRRDPPRRVRPPAHEPRAAPRLLSARLQAWLRACGPDYPCPHPAPRLQSLPCANYLSAGWCGWRRGV